MAAIGVTNHSKCELTISLAVLFVLVSSIVRSSTGNDLVAEFGFVVFILELLIGLGLVRIWTVVSDGSRGTV